MPEKSNEVNEKITSDTQQINRRSYLKLASAAGSGLGTGIGARTLGTEFTTPAQAASTVVDDFGDTNLSGRYSFDQSGATTSVTTLSSAVTSEANKKVLQMEGGGTTEMNAFKEDSDTDLDAYPEIGDTFSCWLRGLNGTENMNFSYGVKDKDSKYYVKLNLETGALGLFQIENDSGGSLAGDWSNSTIQNNTGWFKVEIDWTTGHEHTVTIWQNGSEVTSISYTEGSGDPKFTANGVGFAGYLTSGETAQFDYVTTTGEPTNTNSSIAETIDDFEVSNRSLEDVYDFDRGKAGASIVSDSEYSGSNSLESSYNGSHALKIEGSNTEMISRPGDGLSFYPSAGDSLSFWVMASGGADVVNFSYGVQDHANRYIARMNFAANELDLWRLENNQAIPLAGQSTTTDLTEDKWYEVTVDWGTDGTHTLSIYDTDNNEPAEFSYTESSPKWTSGGIGYDAYLANNGGTIYIDDVKLGDTSGRLPGWGVQTMNRSADFDNPYTDNRRAEDFTYALITGGGRERNQEDPDQDGEYERISYTYSLVFGGRFSTYAYPDSLRDADPDNVDSKDILPVLAQGANRWSVNVNNTNLDGYQYVDRNNARMFTLNPTEERWKEMLNSNWRQVAGQNQVRDKAIDSNEQLDKNEPPWYYEFLKWGLGFVPYFRVPVAAYSLADVLMKESGCGRDDDNATATSDYIEWTYCNGGTLTFHVTEVDVTVPENETVNVVIEEEVEGEYAREDLHADNVGQWTLEITGGDPTVEIVDKNTFSRNRIT